MDEVDKIIIHSLRQIGCKLDGGGDDEFSMITFTPESLVHAVSICLQEIKPTLTLPRSLPENMAQRFSIASILAEACANCGYRSDIGYQTFLYPNVVETRRLFMFLIEHLPKDNKTDAITDSLHHPIGEMDVLRREIREKIKKQLNEPWLPQYCRAMANRRKGQGCSSQCVKFQPQPNLNISDKRVVKNQPEVQRYLQQQASNVFQQTAAKEFDLISSVLHKNAMDLYSDHKTTGKYVILPYDTITTRNQFGSNTTNSGSVTEVISNSKVDSVAGPSPLEKLTECVNTLKSQNDALLAKRKITSGQVNMIKKQQLVVQAEIEQLRRDVKLHERTCVVLENPTENVLKLEALIQTAIERRCTLEQQWQDYRRPMCSQLEELKQAKQAKNMQNVLELRALITQLDQEYREKHNMHAQLSAELKGCSAAATTCAPRKEYTRRIHEFIGNIRKQRNDIYKVLDDTRDLQKQLNSVGAQLQRQFNYTDDLLFQNAKLDNEHVAKRAYKLLASLHSKCNEMIELIAQTGNIAKEIRDLEVQIDREKLKNITTSLHQITSDIRNFENVIKNIQSEIRKVENEITAG